ncbi:MAG: energy-coupling factor ABC transporter substrate-binding protein [Acidaminobacteraceae bacterium]
MSKKNIILSLILLAIVIIPLVLVPDADFNGADGNASSHIALVAPGYEPWFTSFWEPPSGEIESLIFAVQASIGTAFIAFVIGYIVGKKNHA